MIREITSRKQVQEKLNRQLYKRAHTLLNDFVELSLFCLNEGEASEAFDAATAEMERLEKLLSTSSVSSSIYQVNANAGIAPVPVSAEVYDLLIRSIKVSELTHGAFDVTQECPNLTFKNLDAHQATLPDKPVPMELVPRAGYKHIELNPEERSVYLPSKGMRLDLGGIGKGYAIERAKIMLTDFGIKSGVVNAAGDFSAWGSQPTGRPWTIGAADTAFAHLPFAHFNISELAVATAGHLEKEVALTGKKTNHSLSTEAHLRATALKTATIACPNAELAKAMATGVRGLDLATALETINGMRNIACVLVDEHDVVHLSENIQLNLAC